MNHEAIVLAEVTRGNLIESRHRGWIVVSDSQGKVIASTGNPDEYVFTRSALKPLQALPLILSGAYAHYNLTEMELAIVCSSHSAEEMHIQQVQSLLQKVDLSPEALQCGSHSPLNQLAAEKLMRTGLLPQPLHNNCSGKHAGMLVTTCYKQWDINTYLADAHPLQQGIREAILILSDLSESQLYNGIDGCSAPNYCFPLRLLAMAYARFVHPVGLTEAYQEAVCTIYQAMSQYPHYVAGTDRFDTTLMQLVPGTMAKGGAQGVFALASPEWNVGIAIKVEDGQQRATPAIVVEVLKQLGFLSTQQQEALSQWNPERVLNWKGTEVGQIRPVFQL